MVDGDYNPSLESFLERSDMCPFVSLFQFKASPDLLSVAFSGVLRPRHQPVHQFLGTMASGMGILVGNRRRPSDVQRQSKMDPVCLMR